MPAQFSLLLAGVLLVGLPSATSPDDNIIGGQAPSNLEVFSDVAGKVVGAAAFCNEISSDRVTAATEGAAMLASLHAANDAESTSARNLFTSGAIVGMEAVRGGQVDCGLVEASLTSLERAEQRERIQPAELQEDQD
jgi:hypothetical protein